MKNAKRLLCLITFLLIFKAVSQEVGIINFGKSSAPTYCGDGIIDNEGNHVFIVEDGDNSVIVSRNPDFEVNWYANLTDHHQFGSGKIIQLSNGNYFIGLLSDYTGKGYYMVMTSEGEVLWNRRIGEYSAVREILELNDGNLAVICSVGFDAMVLIIDENGDLLNGTKITSAGVHFFPRAVAKTNDDHFVVFISTDGEEYNTSNATLIKFDFETNVIWQKNFVIPNVVNFYGGVESTSGDLFFVGSTSVEDIHGYTDIILSKFDSDGNNIVTKTLGSAGAFDSGIDIQLEDEDLIILGSTQGNNGGKVNLTLMRVNSDLNLIYFNAYGADGREGIFKTLHKKDNYFYTFGTSEKWSTFSTKDGAFVLFDQTLALPCDWIERSITNLTSFVLVESEPFTEIASYEPFIQNASTYTSSYLLSRNYYCKNGTVGNVSYLQNFDIKFSPNPVNNSIVILNVTNENGAELKLFDITGKLIRTDRLKTGDNSIDLSNVPAGTYLAMVSTSTETFTERLIVWRN